MSSFQFQSVLEKFDTNLNLWGYHFMVPDEVAFLLLDGNDRRVKCTLFSTETISCALMPKDGHYFILVNAGLRKKFQLELGDKVEVELEKDDSEFGMPVPEEFQVAMDMDEEGAKFFQQLSPGKKRSLLYIAGKVKGTDSRIKKSLAILHHLRQVHGKLDFKRLAETIKEFNSKF